MFLIMKLDRTTRIEGLHGGQDRGTDEATTTTTTRTEEGEEDGAPTTLGQELNE